MRWLSFFVRRRVAERQLDKELRFHLEQQINDRLSRSWDEPTAADLIHESRDQ
ncbi:MAG: hypothetical protein LAP85_09305 [Acidobacteriia bacterium]|nr:hypothetical protein [Terriglobia bacterium]